MASRSRAAALPPISTTTPPPLEIELKLTLPAQQVAAFVRLMARRRCTPLRQTLRTRYFDTPDFALSAQGIALRVRRAGRRWLQTLKTEGLRHGGLSQRAEYEMPITRGEPDWSRFPDTAAAWVPDALRERLVPVFETNFERTVWLLKSRNGATIEVALDVGEVRAGARSQAICEIELELKAGRADTLFELALAWARQFDVVPLDISKAERGVRLAHDRTPAPVKSAAAALNRGMLVEDGFAALCQSCLAHFQANLPGVLAPLPNPLPQAGEGANVMSKPIYDIEYIHQARVALRRLRALLRMTRQVVVFPDELMAGLRTLATALGTARDWDVLYCETLPPIGAHYADASAWQQGVAAFEAQRATVRGAMLETLGQARPGAWLLGFQRWLLQRGWRAATATQRFIQLSPLREWAQQAMHKGHRRVVHDARDFRQLQPLQRHALRIVIKRQRYAVEFFRPLFAGPQQDRYLAALSGMQDSLGAANDARVAATLLKAVGGNAEPVTAFALGWLAAQLADAAAGGKRDRVMTRQLKKLVDLQPDFHRAAGA
jgi:inorganic triphosphatase YgiF